MPFKVKAILKGYCNHKIQEEGQVFYIKSAEVFSDFWMQSLDSKLNAELERLKPGYQSPAPATQKVEVIQPHYNQLPAQKEPEDADNLPPDYFGEGAPKDPEDSLDKSDDVI